MADILKLLCYAVYPLSFRTVFFSFQKVGGGLDIAVIASLRMGLGQVLLIRMAPSGRETGWSRGQSAANLFLRIRGSEIRASGRAGCGEDPGVCARR